MEPLLLPTPFYFHDNADAEKAESLFMAISDLGSGYFPDLERQLTELLAGLFENVPCDRDGYKILGNVRYHKTGLASCTGTKKSIIMPIFEQSQCPDEKQKDTESRIKMLQKLMRQHRYSTFVEKQIKHAITGRKPIIRSGAIGKYLLKIDSITTAIEQSEIQDPQMLGSLYGKIHDITSGPLHTLKTLPDGTCERVFFGEKWDEYINFKEISYIHGNTLKEFTDTMLKGTLTEERLRAILRSVMAKTERKNYIPLPSLIRGNWYNFIADDAYIRMMSDKMQELNAFPDYYKHYVEKLGKDNADARMSNFVTVSAHRLAHSKTDVIVPIYDAIQAYKMYDSIEDEDVRELLYQAGYLVKDWVPDDDLWKRTAKLCPATIINSHDAQEYDEIEPGARIECRKTANEYLNHKIDMLEERIVEDKQYWNEKLETIQQSEFE